MQENISVCPLCNHPKTSYHSKDARREYLKCFQCDLIFVSRKFLLTPAEEKQHYSNHTNKPSDLNYQRFLNKLVNPLLKLLEPNSEGLDFGCGPGPTISVMMDAHGHTVENYDPYFYNTSECLKRSYDFITCTEAIEHFNNPLKELLKLHHCIKPNGFIALMTQLTDNQNFNTWYYKNDPTHINFFSSKTMRYISDRFNYSTVYLTSSEIIFQLSKD